MSGGVGTLAAKVVRRCRYELVRALRGGTAAARSLGVQAGEGCRLITRNWGTEPWLVAIGDRVTVAHGATFLTHDGSLWLVRDERGRRYRYARIIVGNDAFIGVNALILPGVHIGDRVVVAAGSVVTRSVPSGAVVAGNPARLIDSYDAFVARALASCPSDSDLSGGSFRERVESIASSEPRETL